MRLSRPILGAVVAVLLAPQAAQAAVLDPLGPCYRSVDSETREVVPVLGRGFTPGQTVTVRVDGIVAQDGVVADKDGNVSGSVQAPYRPSGERPFTISVTEDNQPGNTASATSRVTALDFRLKPQEAKPSTRVRFIGRGFTDGTSVYAHYVRKGRHRKTVRLGAAQGACGTIAVKRRQIPVRDPALGRWTLQVDNSPVYSAEPAGVAARWFITVSEGPRRPG